MFKATKLAALLALIGVTGCAGLSEFMAAEAKRSEEAKQKALIEARLAQNPPDHVKGTSVGPVAIAAKKMIADNGYNCVETYDRSGGDGQGVTISCTKTKAVDLGQAVGMNVLGNMLGADRGKIIKSETDEIYIGVRIPWNPDGKTAYKGLVGFEITGKSFKTNQNNQRVEERDLPSDRKQDLVKYLQAQFPK